MPSIECHHYLENQVGVRVREALPLWNVTS